MKKFLIFLFLVSVAFSQTSVPVGSAAKFSVTADGTPPFQYTWFKDNAPINDSAGHTGSHAQTYTVDKWASTDAGIYRVSVENPAGRTDSAPVTLTTAVASVAPVFTLQPTAKSVSAGNSVTFSGLAIGTPSPTYQWFKNGVAIPGATSAALALNAVTSADVGTYTLKATNSAGSVTSSGAALTVTYAIASNVKVTITVSP